MVRKWLKSASIAGLALATGAFGGALYCHHRQWQSGRTVQFHPAALLRPDTDSSVLGMDMIVPEGSANTDRRSGSASDRPLSRYFIADAVSIAKDATVSISSEQEFAWFVSKASGSGFIISEDGTIVTNAHVVAFASSKSKDKNKELTVALTDGRSFKGRVLALDERSDVALVKVDTTDPLPVAKLGDSDKLRVGEFVVALGCPLQLSNTVTHGIVSAVERKGADLGLSPLSTFIQTDAPINQGNSGGPLVNLDGEVIGINSLKADVSGISFAIPIKTAKEIVDQLQKYGRVIRPYTGMFVITISPYVSNLMRQWDRRYRNVDLSEGVFVPDVIEGSPADAGGIRPLDLILSINGKPVRTAGEVMEITGNSHFQPLQIEINRQGKKMTLSVTPAPEPEEDSRRAY
eukprot:ANDGO_06316.mRNA.1 Putative protease Do-like 14